MIKVVGFANMVFCFKLVKDKILPVICIDWLKSGYLYCDCSLDFTVSQQLGFVVIFITVEQLLYLSVKFTRFPLDLPCSSLGASRNGGSEQHIFFSPETVFLCVN